MTATVVPTGAGRSDCSVAFRCSSEWRTYLDLLARKTARTRAGLLEAACVEFARAHGLPDPPSRQAEPA
jgi:hypothetical protein